MKSKKAVHSLYNKNETTQALIIEVSLDDYSEIFNGWDASPLRRKDMEPELLDYLEQAADEIKLSEKVEICFYLPQALHDDDKEAKSITGVQNNFKVVLFFIEKTLHRHYRQIGLYILMSTLFLIAAYTIRGVTTLPLLFSILIEGLFIGGWVLLWEAFSLFFFTTHETRQRRKLFRRYLESDIYFKDKKD
ncbi:MAG: hypothetical protein IH571_04150 [Acholeplasmataceae bacterium]|nr:hypothetical protein [Acholeplasmataceae bacterium]